MVKVKIIQNYPKLGEIFSIFLKVQDFSFLAICSRQIASKCMTDLPKILNTHSIYLLLITPCKILLQKLWKTPISKRAKFYLSKKKKMVRIVYTHTSYISLLGLGIKNVVFLKKN